MKKSNYLLLTKIILIGPLYANPEGGQVVSGNASFHHNEKILEIQAADQSVIHWKDFSIDSGETTRFLQPNAAATVLNKVLGFTPSQINGVLEANGNVILINPQGVVIGKNGIINTANFTASTLDLISSSQLQFEGDSTAAIVNYGTISTALGDVVLVALNIDNQGTIQAPLGKVTLAAGSHVLLAPSSDDGIYIRSSVPSGSIQNSGVISAVEVALKTEGSAYALAVNAGSLIQATGIAESNGRILLVADGGDVAVKGDLVRPGGHVEVRGKNVYLLDEASIDVSGTSGGGTVFIGTDRIGNDPSASFAERVFLGPDATIHADALTHGDGGKVIFWREKYTEVYGSISARGGTESGDGGFAEISGRELMELPWGLIDLRAPAGKTGTLLIDPDDVIIDAGPTTAGVILGPSTTLPAVSPVHIKANGAGSLSTQLGLSNVGIDTNAGGAAATGTLTVTSPVSWASANSLTLESNVNMTINSQIQSTGTGNITLITRPGGGGDIQIGSSVLATPSSVQCTGGGTVTIQADGDLLVQGGLPGGTAFINGTGGTFGVDITANGTTGVTLQSSVALSGVEAHIVSTTGLKMNIPNGSYLMDTNTTLGTSSGFTKLEADFMNVTAGVDFRVRVGDIDVALDPNAFVHLTGTSGTPSTFNMGGSFIMETIAGFLTTGQYTFTQANSPTTITAGTSFILSSDSSNPCLMALDRLTTINTGYFIMDNTGPATAPLQILGNTGLVVNANANVPFSFFFENLGTSVVQIAPATSTALMPITLNGSGSILTFRVGGPVGDDILVESGSNLVIRSTSGNIQMDQFTHFKTSSKAVVPGTILVSAGGSLFMHSDSSIQVMNNLPGSFIDVVVDQLNPFPPSIGSGHVNMAPGASIDGNGLILPIRIFTAKQSLNTFNGTINGFTFTPGPQFVNTPTEIWGTYFSLNPTAGGGGPDFYTILYKSPIPSIPQVSQTLGNAFDAIDVLDSVDMFGYPLTAYKSWFCVYDCRKDMYPGVSSLKTSFWNSKKVDAKTQLPNPNLCDFIQIQNYRKHYRHRSKTLTVYDSEKTKIDKDFSCPNQ